MKKVIWTLVFLAVWIGIATCSIFYDRTSAQTISFQAAPTPKVLYSGFSKINFLLNFNLDPVKQGIPAKELRLPAWFQPEPFIRPSASTACRSPFFEFQTEYKLTYSGF